MPRVVLAMSGGVDSSVSAWLLKKQGYDVVGLFMRTGVHAHDDDTPAHKKGCCSAVDAGDARRVADRLDIPFYALDFESDFERIKDYFADEYARGRTPNPCVVCNNWLKFGKLWQYGEQLEADFIATGHYVQIDHEPLRLRKGLDPNKDQSYVLFGLQRSLLPRLLFPIGGMRKDEVRALAREAGLGVAEKPDSVEICFVPGNDHFAFLQEHRPGVSQPGVIRDKATGAVLAEHDGIERFTIGQRKGLGFGGGSRRYVLEIVPETRDVWVGDPADLLASGLRALNVNWLIEPTDVVECQAKIRYRAEPAPARVTLGGAGEVRVEFAEPQTAVTPGQAVVFYRGDQVLGGGWIEEALMASGGR